MEQSSIRDAHGAKQPRIDAPLVDSLHSAA